MMTKAETTDNEKLLTLIMPVYNEGDAVIPVISTLFLTIKHPFKIFVVHDSPDDPTVKTVKKLQKHFKDVHLVQNDWDRGVLNAIKTGFRKADTPYVGVWVAYHLDPFRILDDMLEKMENGCDLVSANRFTIDSSRARGNTIKKLFSKGGNIVLNKIIGMPISDITTSIKVYRQTMLDKMEIETVVNGGWAVNAELAIKAAIGGFRMDEIHLEKKNMTLVNGLTNFKVLKQLPTYFQWLYLGWKNRKLIKSYHNK